MFDMGTVSPASSHKRTKHPSPHSSTTTIANPTLERALSSQRQPADVDYKYKYYVAYGSFIPRVEVKDIFHDIEHVHFHNSFAKKGMDDSQLICNFHLSCLRRLSSPDYWITPYHNLQILIIIIRRWAISTIINILIHLVQVTCLIYGQTKTKHKVHHNHHLINIIVRNNKQSRCINHYSYNHHHHIPQLLLALYASHMILLRPQTHHHRRHNLP